MSEAASEVRLRPATVDDVQSTFEWANDPVTRAASFDSAEIPYEGHRAWFTSRLADPARHFFIGVAEEGAVGLLRLEPGDRDGWALISINVAPAARGKGRGTALLRAASVQAWALGFTGIIAFIRVDNVASVRAFERAGYVRTCRLDVDTDRAWRYEVAATPR